MSDAAPCPRCGGARVARDGGDPICPCCAFAIALEDGPAPFAQDGPPSGAGADAPGPGGGALDPPGERRVGPYLLRHLLGEGGMGTVWEAIQETPVRRRVALKQIRLGMDSAPVLARFESERQALALMSHPHIAQVYDAGRAPDGRPYFAMEYVDGTCLTRWCDAHDRPIAERLRLFVAVCGAIQHAHHKGVIHRDIKPSNILVQSVEGQPVPKVIDFGVAKAIGSHLGDRALVTRVGQSVGTPEYMSPEQAGPAGFDVDTRTDVYSLGVVLYELLTGGLPFEARGGDGDDLRRRIREEDPPRPSARVVAAGAGAEAIARRRAMTPAALVRRLRGDLDWIALKALAKDRGLRYGTPEDLASDIRRHLAGEPVAAGPPGVTYRLGKFVRRHTLAVAAGSALLALLVVTAVGMTWQARRVARERDRANREARTSAAALGFLTDIFKVSDPGASRGSAVTAREILDRGAARIDAGLAGEPEVQAQLLRTLGQVYLNLGLYPQAESILDRAVARQRERRGDGDPATLDAVAALAFVYLQEGRYAESGALYGRVLEGRRRALGEDHPDTLVAMNGLATVDSYLGRPAEAERLHRRVLEAQRRFAGEADRNTIATINSLAGDLFGQRRFAEAAALYSEAADLAGRNLGDGNPDAIAYRGNLAVALLNDGKEADAERVLRDALDRGRATLGADHPTVLNMGNTLASFYDRQERYAEAEPIYRDIHDRRARVLGEEHPDTLSSLNNLANMVSMQGRYGEAEAMLRKVLEGDRRLLGDRHPDTTNTLYNLACVASLRGDRAGALGWLDQAVTAGYSHWEHLQRDSDLAPLRGTPAFEALVARAKANPQAQ